MSAATEQQFEQGVHGLKVPILETVETPNNMSVAFAAYGFLTNLVDLNREHFSTENKYAVVAKCYVPDSRILIEDRTAQEQSLNRDITVYHTPLSLGGLTKSMHMVSAGIRNFGYWRPIDQEELGNIDVEFEAGDRAAYHDWRVKSLRDYSDDSLPKTHATQQVELRNLAARLIKGCDSK